MKTLISNEMTIINGGAVAYRAFNSAILGKAVCEKLASYFFKVAKWLVI